MTGRCSNPHCYAPDTACQLGEGNPKDCAAWGGSSQAHDPGGPGGEDAQDVPGDELLLPWTGNTLGSDDVAFVAGRSSPTVVAVVGPHNAGKTTLVGAWFLLLGRGTYRLKVHQFAGSYSLGGWETIAHSLRWEGGVGPTFPLHTPSGGGRRPGLLHMGLRHDDDHLLDLLIADAPGEWFTQWAIDRDAKGAAGARWLGEHADVFLLVADRESLAGPQRGTARGQLQLLARRLGGERRDRSVALVWSKADVDVPAGTLDAVREVAWRAMPDMAEFSVSVRAGDEGPASGKVRDRGDDFIELLDWVLAARRRVRDLRGPSRAADGPFLAYGRG